MAEHPKPEDQALALLLLGRVAERHGRKNRDLSQVHLGRQAQAKAKALMSSNGPGSPPTSTKPPESA
jgi:hypothetical protein